MNSNPSPKATIVVALAVVAAILIALILWRDPHQHAPPTPGPQVPPAVGNTVQIELGQGNEVDITRRTTNSDTRIAITVNEQDKVDVIRPIDMHTGFTVDTSSLPPPNPGSGELLLKATTEKPTDSTSGAFRIECKFAHFLYDDSIVYPGQRGHSHFHAFFGNSDSTGDSTANSIASTGNSTCRGGVANRSSYWVPAIYDVRTKKPIVPTTNIVYYKAGRFNTNGSQDGFTPPVVFSFLPVGLRMIAGNPSAKTGPASQPLVFRWSCIDTGVAGGQQFGSTIPNCPVGSSVQQEVYFPQCWDGVNLDSPDHKSHMSYEINVKNIGDPRGWSHAECPKSHPKVIPHISFNVRYPVTVADDPKHWRLVTDVEMANPAGWTSHGDWRNGWLKDVSDAWLTNCVAANKDCKAHLLGDGRMLSGFGS